MRDRLATGAIVVLALLQGGATDCGNLIDDPGFEAWCGVRLCAWELEKGEVRRAPTWHSEDLGVELVGDDVAISQLSEANHHDGHCVRVTMVADVEEAAEVRLLVDVFNDGTIESDERIPTSDWRRLTYLLHLPYGYSTVRFRLTKRGSGRAVLADVGAEMIDDELCPGPALPTASPDGAQCLEDTDCASGRCYDLPFYDADTCGGCGSDDDCAAGELCAFGGPSPGWLRVAPRCMAPGALDLGRACLRDETCASGVCADGQCGECRDAADCGGLDCLPAAYGMPARCDHGGAAGAPCFRDSDCDSGRCAGEPLLGCDGSPHRACVTDDDCPGELTDPTNTSCGTVGFAGGVCR